MRDVIRTDGQLDIEDHGLIGDGQTCALVSLDGRVNWMCIPEFDSPPFFSSLLDHERGGEWGIAPVGVREAHQSYVADTSVLNTRLRGEGGTIEIIDAMTVSSGADLAETVPAAREEFIRRATALGGEAEIEVRFKPFGLTVVRPFASGWRISSDAHPDVDINLWTSHPLQLVDGALTARVTLRQGESFFGVLHWSSSPRLRDRPALNHIINQTVRAWERWNENLNVRGPHERMLRRSALTLKSLNHARTGAIQAAGTSSLPEEIGGVRNWDYRYTWVRDAAFSNRALRRVGAEQEADAFLAWVLQNVERDGKPHIMYTLYGKQPQTEIEDPILRGYRGSSPVRWGNGAAGQTQHDVYGEIIDCAYQWVNQGRHVDVGFWNIIIELVESALTAWRVPDHGIWEIRGPGRPFTYSIALCHVAVDRAIRIGEREGLEIPGHWRAGRDEMYEALLTGAWDEGRQTFTESLSDGTSNLAGLDSSLLTLPMRQIVEFTDPRMVKTVDAVTKHLDAGNGLLYRYLQNASPDGLPGEEGAFLLCSFWHVDNLIGQGRLDEAEGLYESLLNRATPLGLLAEEVDPTTGKFLGNFPQAFSHVGVLQSGLALMEAREAQRGGRH